MYELPAWVPVVIALVVIAGLNAVDTPLPGGRRLDRLYNAGWTMAEVVVCHGPLTLLIVVPPIVLMANRGYLVAFLWALCFAIQLAAIDR